MSRGLTYGISTKDPKEYDRVRGITYRAKNKKKMLSYQYDYRRTFEGWLTLTYSHMRRSSKQRGHPMPKFTKKDLSVWISNRDYIFNKLHKNWLVNGCDKWLKPSVDRLDNTKGYRFDNIRLVTWKENCDAARYLKCKKVLYEGVVYGSVTALAKALNVKRGALALAAQRGYLWVKKEISYAD